MKKNPMVHFEIYADDAEKLGQFYSSLFDWTLEPIAGMDYVLIKTVDTDKQGMPTQPGGANGGMMKRPADFESRCWINYVLVDSVDATVERAQKLGAALMKGKSAVPGMGWFAMLSDPQGNVFALWQMDKDAK
jgi:predicted enzyme related to lactoylglutathione lyase